MSLPLVTVGIPTYNRAWSLPKVLEALESLEYPKEKMRLVFVDNYSTDETLEISHAFQKQHLKEYESIRVLVKESNIGQARSVCVQEAEGSDYVLFVDSDIVPPPNTIQRLLGIFSQNPNAGLAGFPPQRNPIPIGERAWFSKLPNKPYVAETIGHDCTMVRMKVYEKVGSYSSAFGADEDTELILRAKNAGFVVILDPSVRVLHLMKSRSSSFVVSVVGYTRFAFSRMAYYRFKLLVEHHHFKTLQKWMFYTLFTLSIPFLLVGIIFSKIFFLIPFIVLFVFLFVFHFVSARGIMRVINPLFYAFMGIMFSAGMWNQFIKHIIRSLQENRFRM